jgi:outer membrane protein TolC
MTASLLLALSLAAPALTMEEAVATALARRPVLAAARGQVAATEAGAQEARGALLPQAGAAARYDLRRDWPARGGAFSDESASASVSADVLVWDFDRTRSRVRAARASALATGHDAEATVQDVVLEVRLAYLGVLEAHALEEVARERLENQERHLAQTTEMVRVGTRAAIDLARLRTQVASARAALVRAGNTVRTARARLDVAMGSPGQAEYATVLPSLPPLAVEGEPLEALFAQAAERRPELASLRASLAASGHVVKAAERTLWPSLRLGGGASGGGLEVTDDSSFAATAGVSLSWPLFDGLSSRAAADAARARLDVGRAQLGDREQRIWEELEVAATSVASAGAELPAAEEALVAARELLGLAEARYREGVGSSLELADAELELASAAAQRVQVGYDLASARARLVRALGREAWE